MEWPSTPDSRTFFERVLALSSEAEQAGNYQTAYHLLMAALHQADFESDLTWVQEVTDLAAEQEARLDALEPTHQLASAAALKRGTQPVYRALQVHAVAIRARLSHRP